jgi:polar amino acid transport system substrate-binding protein
MRARWFGLAALTGLAVIWLSCRRESSELAPEPAASRAPAAKPASAPFEIAVEDDAAPWSQADGTGYANDVVRAAFAAAGRTLKLTVVPYARCKQMVIEGSVVACFAMSKEPGLETSVAFPDDPLFTCEAELVQRSDDARRVHDAAELPRGAVVGVVLGYEYPPQLTAWLRDAHVRIDESRSEELLLRKLAEGRIDAAVVNDNETKSLDYMLRKAHVTGKVASSFRIGELRSFIGFSRRHPDGAGALAAFSTGLRTITASGEQRAIEARWAASTRAGAP